MEKKKKNKHSIINVYVTFHIFKQQE